MDLFVEEQYEKLALLLQCLEQVENAAIVRDLKKKQKLNAGPASRDSYCCAGVSAGDEVVEFVVSVATPFYCRQCSVDDKMDADFAHLTKGNLMR